MPGEASREETRAPAAKNSSYSLCLEEVVAILSQLKIFSVLLRFGFLTTFQHLHIFLAFCSKGYLNQPRDAGVGSLDESKEILADFLDESLQAGVRRGCRLSYSLQPTGNEGAPSSQTMLGMLTKKC